MSIRSSRNKTIWTKVGNPYKLTYMSKDVIIIGEGCIIEFIDINTLEEKHLCLNDHDGYGDGLKCIKGHPNFYIFAYSENCQSPIVYVRSYPNFEIICKFTDTPSEGFKSLAFSETSLLVALGEMPNYFVTVWNWRSKEKFAQDTNALLYENQVISCSAGRPMYLSQLGLGSKKLFIWDIFTVCKTSLFSKHEVKLGSLAPAPLLDQMWSPEGNLYVIDKTGSIYTVDRDFYLDYVIDFSTEGDNSTSLCWFQQGITAYGPNQEIRHYKRKENTWVMDWSYKTEKPLNVIRCNRGDKMIGLTETKAIVTLSNYPESFSYIRENYSMFKEVVILNPCGDYIACLRHRNDLIIYDIKTGSLMSIFSHGFDTKCIATNPEFPCVAVTSTDGQLELISLYNVSKPTVMVNFNLTDMVLDHLKYFELGDVIVAGNKTVGDYFIIRGFPGSQMEVVAMVQCGQQIVDFFLVSVRNHYRFFVLPVTSDKFYAGNKLIRYCINDSKIDNIKEYEWEDTDVLYSRIMSRKGPEKDRVFSAIKFDSRVIHVLRIKRGSPVVTIDEEIKSGHQMKMFHIHSCSRYILTWSFCGLVIARLLDFTTCIGIVLVNHRYLHGVKKACINAHGTIVVTLGWEGNLTAVSLVDREVDPKISLEITKITESTKFQLMFKRPTLGYVPEERFEGKNWKEIQQLKKFEQDARICKVEKDKIWKDFLELQKKLQTMVTQNLEGPENEFIDLVEFYLDTALYNQKQQQNKENAQKTEVYLKCLIQAQDKVSQYVIKNYWEPMGVMWRQIMGIFSAVKATNYCLLPEDAAKLKRLAWVEEQRKVEQYLAHQDSFRPWADEPRDTILEQLQKRPVVPRDDYTVVGTMRGLRDLEDSDSAQSLETRVALAGSVSMFLIDISPGHYEQRELSTFYQCSLQQAVAEEEVTKLKQNYNKCFNDTLATKEREMYLIKEKNARLRHIISEYNYFSEKKVFVDIVDPEWAMTEYPSQVLSVQDDEIQARPYVSPSEQAILDAKAAEEERLRLLMLADDFRERALMSMMNGVLEIRWEDELKKEVPKPTCMLKKEPEAYNEDDLRAIRQYEEKCTQLQSEREKYKTLLEVEFTKLSTSLRESIRKFNHKLYECTKYKFYIDQGMNQENLQVNRARFNQNERLETDEREAQILQSLKDYENLVEQNLKTISLMQEAMIECRATLEQMQGKERLLEKAYKRDFQEMPPIIQEQALKLYKKRPKATYKNITTATIMNELARCVMTNEFSFSMTQDCVDYLKSLQQFDQFVGLPAQIDEHAWSLICRHRRLKIEYDLRFRAAQIQIMDGEATIQTFQKRVQTQKEKIIRLHEELAETREHRLHLIHNKEIQIVLRRGLVEIPLTGDIFTDFEDAILVPKKEIEEVNQLIINAGKVKLKTIKQNMKFRRNVMALEWEHMKLRMQINDLIEQKKDIEVVKFTKEMQRYLKNKSLGRNPEQESYESEVELLVAAYQNQIKDKKDKFEHVNKSLRHYQEQNKKLDKDIEKVNIDVCDFTLKKDFALEAREQEILDARMKAMLHRSSLVEKVQRNHNEILVLQTELELLRLKTFPTFKYKVMDENVS